MRTNKTFPLLVSLLLLPIIILAQINSTRTTKTISQQQSLRNIVTCQGMITIPPEVYSKMQQEWHLAANSIPGNPVRIQLWNVIYQPDPKKRGYAEILLQQQVDPINLSYQLVPGGIIYKMNLLLSGNNLAIVVISNKINSLSGLAIKGKPSDGSPQAFLHRYESDAKNRIGQNITYGVYSITPGKTDWNHLDFVFSDLTNTPGQKALMDSDPFGFVEDIANEAGKFANRVLNGVEYVFDQTVDEVTDLAKYFVKGAEDAAGFFINESGQIFYEIGGTLINLVAFRNLPRERSLKQEEYDWANERIFNYTLPDINRIKVFNFMNPDHHRFYTWPGPTGDYIYMNIGDAFDDPVHYVDNINHAYPVPGQVFIHELSHAWQIGKYGFAGMLQKYISSGGLNQNYNQGCGINNINSHFNIEQEATLVDRTFLQLYYHLSDSSSCDFEQQWVELNVRKGVKFDIAKIAAINAMQQLAKNLTAFVGNVDNADAVYSKGNGKDGDGYFMLGSVPWSVLYYTNKDKIAHANWGEIRKKYNSVSAEQGYLGWPYTPGGLTPLPKGFCQKFQNGYIYSTAQYGTFIVDGFILDAWTNRNMEKGELGYPISDYIPDNNSGNNSNKLLQRVNRGGYQKFEHGLIKWSGIPGTQAEVILTNTLINNKTKKIIH
jgi:hypothetical protein